MPASAKQIEANRANAARSTGPRSVEGKQRSKMNALVHGLTAQAAVLPGEDPAELELLSSSLMRQLRPSGVVQRIMAERIVSLAWKLRRVARAEEAIGRQMQSRSGEDRYGVKHRRRDGASFLSEAIRPSGERTLMESCDGRLRAITDYELKLDGALRASVRELLRLQKDADAFEDPGDDSQAGPVVERTRPVGEVGEPRADEDEGAKTSVAGEAEQNREPNSDAPARTEPVSGAEAPIEETNPIAGAGESPQREGCPGVTTNDRGGLRPVACASAPRRPA